ncbi:uncharacterized protein [Primulina eburnea]|uniref:uncharacterized protein n=1 Tax=Primulina eburnea TaxID=1245227 RepID=UPI003C6BEEFE
MWKASKDIIPTDVNLLSHHIPILGTCSLCNYHYASTSHCLLFCLAIKDVWKHTPFWYCLKKHRDASFLDCALYVAKRFNQEEFELFVILCWAIWRETCLHKHEAEGKSMQFRVDWVYAFLDSIRYSSLKCIVSVCASQTSTDHLWKPPSPNLLRLDVDAGFDTMRNKFSVGAIIRDSRGVTRGAHALIICNPGSVLAAEILAIRCGIDLCLQVDVSSVCIFSDSKEAVRLVLNPDLDTGPWGALALEVNSMFLENHFVSIKHMHRSVNSVAHSLAHKAFNSSSNLLWQVENILSWLYSIVNQDLPI